MRVFISWSGERGHKVALALREWLPDVLQSVVPWVSSQDIRKGDQWLRALTDELSGAKYGILCVTPENQNEPWLCFEAGAMAVAQTVGPKRVAPLAIGMRKGQIANATLSQFQASDCDEKDVFLMLGAINNELGDEALEPDRLKKSFERWWPELAQKFAEAIATEVVATPPPKREAPEILEEVVNLVRSLARGQESTSTILQSMQKQLTYPGLPSSSAVGARLRADIVPGMPSMGIQTFAEPGMPSESLLPLRFETIGGTIVPVPSRDK